MIVKLNCLFISMLMMIFFSCASSNQNSESRELEVKILDVYTWLNLMPGNPGQFFLQCEMELLNTTNKVLDNIRIERVEVYSEEKIVFNFIPVLEPVNLGDEMILQPGDSLKLRLRTESGIRMGSIEIPEDKVDIKFSVLFVSGKTDIELTNLIVERAY